MLVKPDATVSVRVVQHVEHTRLADMLCSALEGGSNDWYMLEHWVGVHDFVHEVPFNGGYLKFSAMGDDGEYNFNHGGETSFRLDMAAIAIGAQVMADHYPRHWGNFMTENDDAETGDVFLQCCLFGEVIFG